MKQVMEYYGGAIIAVIVAAAVIMVFWKIPYSGMEGVPEILGELVNGSLEEERETEPSSGAFTEYMSSSVPEIKVNSYSTCLTGCWNFIRVYLSARDENGKYYPVTLQKGWNVSDASVQMEVSSDGKRFFCKQPGEYWVSARVALPSGRTRTETLKIVANGEVVP